MLLRCSRGHGYRRAAYDGLLSLHIVSPMVSQPSQRLHNLGSQIGSDHQGCRERRKLSEDQTVRKWGQACGGHLLTEHPLWLVTEVPAAILPDLQFKPAVHLHYAKLFSTLGMVFPSRKTFGPNLEVRESC
jgi:hypothetical protein